MEQTAESVLRGYIQFDDVNQSETIELLPLTIIDAMDEYVNQQERSYSEEDLKEAFFSGCQSERQIKPRIKCWNEWFEQFKKK
jgi:hypothetical protein